MERDYIFAAHLVGMSWKETKRDEIRSDAVSGGAIDGESFCDLQPHAQIRRNSTQLSHAVWLSYAPRSHVARALIVDVRIFIIGRVVGSSRELCLRAGAGDEAGIPTNAYERLRGRRFLERPESRACLGVRGAVYDTAYHGTQFDFGGIANCR